jgi:hypothetical protein
MAKKSTDVTGIEIHIDIQNSAFSDRPNEEVARILRDIARKIENSSCPVDWSGISVRDYNGNKVGQIVV